MGESEGFLRYASEFPPSTPRRWLCAFVLTLAGPNERRTISREDVGFYHATIVGAIYDLEDQGDIASPATYFHPLRLCIEELPVLCVTVGDMHTDKAFYQRVPRMNLAEHVFIETADSSATAEGREYDDLEAIRSTLAATLDRPFQRGIPPWRIVVTPVPSSPSRRFIAFCYSHTIGDGTTALSFHRTFLRALNARNSTDKPLAGIVETPWKPFPIPFDTPERLPISWSYLLSPLIRLIFPRFLVEWLGLPSEARTWTGSRIHFDPDKSRTNVAILEIEPTVLDKAIRVSREHDAKLTAVLGQLVARALHRAIPDQSITAFSSQTPVNMRRAIGLPDDQTGQFVSVSYVRYDRDACRSTTTHDDNDNDDGSRGVLSEREWAAAASATRKFAKCAGTLRDQPIGLLRYLRSIRTWTLGKIGEERDSSFEVSNVGVFDEAAALAGGDGDRRPGRSRMTKVVFAQPGLVAGPPIAVSAVSLKGGGLICTVTWRAGALGVPEDEEVTFVDRLCASIRADFEGLANDS